MIVSGILIQQKEVVAINMIRKYMAEIDIKSSKTFHEFETNLPAYIQNHINVIKMGTIKKRLSSIYMNHESCPITEMNELYISAIGGDGSDKVFETEHVDGPFFFLPFCNVYRCIVAIKGNKSIFTCFPKSECFTSAISDNEFIAFDYNRDPHFIFDCSDIQDYTKRVVLKLHYIVYPSFLPKTIVSIYKILHYRYNSMMRKLFLKSQIKKSIIGSCINYGTVIFCNFYNIYNDVKKKFFKL